MDVINYVILLFSPLVVGRMPGFVWCEKIGEVKEKSGSIPSYGKMDFTLASKKRV